MLIDKCWCQLCAKKILDHFFQFLLLFELWSSSIFHLAQILCGGPVICSSFQWPRSCYIRHDCCRGSEPQSISHCLVLLQVQLRFWPFWSWNIIVIKLKVYAIVAITFSSFSVFISITSSKQRICNKRGSKVGSLLCWFMHCLSLFRLTHHLHQVSIWMIIVSANEGWKIVVFFPLTKQWDIHCDENEI